MKYNIFINQEKLSKDKELSLSDCAVFDYIHTICGSDSTKINNKRLEGFTWVNLNHLITEMPLLRIKTASGASRIISKLVKLGYIETKTDTKDRKLYVKPTDKMKSIFFGEVVADTQEVVAVPQEGRCVQATNHNTIYNNTNINNKEQDVPSTSKSQTVTTQDKIISVYSRLYNNTYGVKPKLNYGLFKKTINDLLKHYTGTQIASMLIVFFKWKGMDDSNMKEYNFLSGNAFPITMFKASVNKYEIYLRNVVKIDFDNDEIMLSFVNKSLLSTA